MSYFEDLSDYTYHGSWCYRPGTKNVGWLGVSHDFSTWDPTNDCLNCVLDYCTVAVAQMRGLHLCELCPQAALQTVIRAGKQLLLGSAEIRVFAGDGDIYAAPNLIYHYILVHHYKPPDTFLQAVRERPRPPSQEYFDELVKYQLDWSNTPEYAGPPFRFVRKGGVVVREPC